MTQKLQGKAAVVTGAGSPVGVGRSVALALAAEGAGVVVNDIFKYPDGSNGADKVVEEIQKAGGSAVASYDSVTTMLGGENMVKAATSKFGRMDILVNCAANSLSAPVVEMTEKQWDSIMNVHLKGHFFCCRAAAKEMIRQKSGRIINFSSGAAFNFSPGYVTAANFRPRTDLAYAAAKAGILGLTAELSAELKHYNITVNAIWPSAMTTLFPDKRPQSLGGVALASEVGGPDFVAPIVVYLATDESQKITGRFFYASGGDIIIYQRPMQFKGGHSVIRKNGKWTLDELDKIIPSLIVPD